MNNGRDMTAGTEGFKGAHVLIAFLSGAAAGAITAFLTAPGSGADQRQKARQLPEALKAATTAAQEAFVTALNGDRGHGSRAQSHRDA